MCICEHECVLCLQVYTYLSFCLSACICVSVVLCVCAYVCVCICTCLCICNVYVYISMCMHVSVLNCVHVHTCTFCYRQSLAMLHGYQILIVLLDQYHRDTFGIPLIMSGNTHQDSITSTRQFHSELHFYTGKRNCKRTIYSTCICQ